MPETPRQWYDRVVRAIEDDGHRETDLPSWTSWPWTGELTVKALDEPVETEPDRRGVGGVDCHSCATGADPATGGAVWWDELFFVVPARSSSLPFAMFLMPRRHCDLATMTPEEARRQGELLTALEQTATATMSVPRIQVARWGDGGEHLHWWVYARPTGMLQLRGTFLSHWDDLLPPRPLDDVAADARVWAADLVTRVGGTAAS
ncbi:hypothetical protein [Aestuariimicrobium ganziense]|uniref:hypothetical protein n=1 Tax=Aestuariimicrobium ganziense TaxID=2773677 RepID=UPI001943015F|nr:hypothetical protein [Aestuariimicrobium ganziense]